MDLKTPAGLGRFRDIATILMKYGFDDLVDRFDIPGIGLFGKRTSEEIPLESAS